ncbi:MAG: hypothetical protein LIO97_00065 [Tannerellaceae bacterium]|nr:hypothetical protein [Tannerellaceae bacterium]
MPIAGTCPEEIVLEEKTHLLGEITVSGKRPQVKVSGGGLVYDTPQLIKGKAITNAFEAIRELPGIISQDDELSLLGAGSVSIVINGQLTNLSPDQLINMLKSIPASRVKQTEIMYNAPARYNVKGALINVVIEQDKSQGDLLQGEVGVEYNQRHYANGLTHANLLYTTSRFSLDVLANGNKGRFYGGENMFARHTLDTGKVEIDQVNRSRNNRIEGTFRIGTEYQFTNTDRLSASYYINADDMAAQRTSASDFNYLQESLLILAASTTDLDRSSALHNFKVQYDSHTDLTAGIDFVSYRNPESQEFLNCDNEIVTTDLQNNSR